MLNVPSEVQALFKNSSAFKNFHVHFPNGENADLNNEDVISESVSFTESACSKEVFQFGLSERSQIEFESVDVPNIYGVNIYCAIEICVDSLGAQWIADHAPTGHESFLDLQVCTYDGRNMYRIPYGSFIVQSCPRSHGAMYRRRVTAYSLQPIEETNVLGGVLKSVTPWKSVSLTMPILNAILGVNELDSADITFTENTNGYTGIFCNSSGHTLYIKVQDMPYRYWNISGYSDLVKLDIQENGERYDAFGRCIAEMLDNAGIDILYDSSGSKIFDDTETALRAYMPTIFSPFVDYNSLYDTADVSTVEGICSYVTPVKSGVLTPVFKTYNKGVQAEGGKVVLRKRYYSANQLRYCERSPLSLRVMVSDITADTTVYLTFTPTEKFPRYPSFTCTLRSAKRYYQSTDEPAVLKINSTLTVPNGLIVTFNRKKETGYTYANAFSWSKAVDGFLELNGQFGRYSRFGEFERMDLDRSNPIRIRASDYSAVWYDDYSIDGVGLITYRFGNNDTVAYSIGDGGSVYDMTSNYLLEHYVVEDTETAISQIQNLLDNYFVPKLDDLSYLPSDGTLIGLPYLEAGDYIEIAIGAGETIGTYILTRTLTGIQVLTDTIESKGGEVLGDGS